MGFQQDLKDGEAVEQEVLLAIKKKFPHAYKEEGKFHREFYDIIIPKLGKQPEIKFEVKGDFFPSSNMAFECMGRNAKSTGIIRTTSHIWIQFRKGSFMIWKTRVLKRYLLDLGGHLRDCGDQKASCAWVVPEEKILKECPPNATFKRGSLDIATYIQELL